MSIDWVWIRRQLTLARTIMRRPKDGKSWTLDDLQRFSGLDKATLHRVENVKRFPAYRPQLDTIEQWLLATTRVPLSAGLLSQLRPKLVAEYHDLPDVSGCLCQGEH